VSFSQYSKLVCFSSLLVSRLHSVGGKQVLKMTQSYHYNCELWNILSRENTSKLVPFIHLPYIWKRKNLILLLLFYIYHRYIINMMRGQLNVTQVFTVVQCGSLYFCQAQFQLAIAVAIELSLALLSLLNSPPTRPPSESIKAANFNTTTYS
jgi:hypothetical protein